MLACLTDSNTSGVFCCSMKILRRLTSPGGHSAHTHGSVQEIFRQPKNITSASMQPKNISLFYIYIYINLYMNIKYPQTMQIEVRISSIEPRNINIKMFGVSKNVINIVSVFFGPKNITFGNILTQKYRTYLPVCACAECPPPWADISVFGVNFHGRFKSRSKCTFKVRYLLRL